MIQIAPEEKLQTKIEAIITAPEPSPSVRSVLGFVVPAVVVLVCTTAFYLGLLNF